jgi:hypothetical protein
VIVAGAPPKAPAPRGSRPKAAGGRRLPWPVLAAAGAVVVGVIITAAWLISRRQPSVAPEQSAVPVAQAPPTPLAPAAAPAPAPAAAPESTTTTSAAADLESAITTGDIARIRTLLAGLSKGERAEIEGTSAGKQRLDQARRVAALDATIAKAMKSGNRAAAVEQASNLVKLLPASRQARQVRESAAASLEADADALLSKGQGEAALATLRALQRAWPDRPGLEARIAGARSVHEADQRFAAALAAAGTAEKERHPDEGLAALAQLTPDARWHDRFAAARARLEALLAELDKEPPQIRLKPKFKLEYSRGKPVTLQLVVTDDHRVKSVTVMARPEGTRDFQSLPAKAVGGDEYDVEITPELHQNKTVELYAVAVDDSGHVSKLGTAEKPLELKKRFLFF